MDLIEQFWNHLRNADGDDIAFSLYIGWALVFCTGVAVFVIWALVEWLGVLVIGLPFAIIAALLIFYGIGNYIIKRFDL